MITRSLIGETTLVLIASLQLVVVVYSSAISSSPVAAAAAPPPSSSSQSTGSASKQNSIQNSQSQPQYQQQQQQQIQSTTALPILLTTIVQDNLHYANSIKQQQGTKQQQQQQQQHYHSEGTKQRSANNNDDHDADMVPLATVNNHSRNNQVALRPPQYVDVSALIGQRNLSSSGGGTSNVNSFTGSQQSGGGGGAGGSNSLNSNSIMANSVLSPKSRSGLPECATQQVCNAIFVRMNHTQRLCECSSNYNWKCSNNLDPQDGHTIELTRKFDKRIYTQIKTCEPLREVRACKSPTDWTLLALQSERSGKAHYVVVCKCPTWAQLEGPYTHNHPPYANIPGIRVYGMLCAHQTARSSSAQTYAAYNPALGIYPEFPWSEALNVLNTTNLASTLDSAH